MKLPNIELSIEKQLSEFDIWITPSLQDIQDTEKYKDELQKVDLIISRLGSSTNSFDSIDHCRPSRIAETCINTIEVEIEKTTEINEKINLAIGILESFISLLFTVTGKSDNNLKCQFPVFLLHTANQTTFPHKRTRAGKVFFESNDLGRVLKSDKISKLISESLVWSKVDEKLSDLKQKSTWLLENYVSSILQNENNIKQFWSLGRSYFHLKKIDPGSEKALLAPIITFKVRGSVSASGGHIPEDLLRNELDMWGLERGYDYNIDDVIIGDDNDGLQNTINAKTRAYDFILPYKTDNWEYSIFIQCQFYAGDSGSVSHKVVDQTSASRRKTLQQYPNAKFVEYIDGAGYFASLNTDLGHMIRMETTKSFIQVRSINIRLRRELQQIGFITPIEIEHAILQTQNGNIDSVKKILADENYKEEEINRGIKFCLDKGLIQQHNNSFTVNPERVPIARKFLIMDIVAIIGEEFEKMKELTGTILIPGYGALFGSSLKDLSEKIDSYARRRT